MKRLPTWFWALLLGAILLTAAIVACGKTANTNLGTPCDISSTGLQTIPFFAACADPTGKDNIITVKRVLGTAKNVANGQAFDISGTFNFSSPIRGYVELAIDCPGTNAYDTCISPFFSQKGNFDVRVLAETCGAIDVPNEIRVMVWNDAGGVLLPFCLVYVGQTTDDDDDISPDDDASPDDDTSPLE
jgi:hypothetical protein